MEKGFGLNPKAVAQRDASFGCRQCMHDVQCPSDFLKVACSQVEYLDIVNCFWFNAQEVGKVECMVVIYRNL